MEKKGLLLSFALVGVPVLAAPQATPEMMAKFKQLSPAQQQALAAQYGIDQSQVDSSSAQTSSAGIQIISATLMDEWREVANC